MEKNTLTQILQDCCSNIFAGSLDMSGVRPSARKSRRPLNVSLQTKLHNFRYFANVQRKNSRFEFKASNSQWSPRNLISSDLWLKTKSRDNQATRCFCFIIIFVSLVATEALFYLHSICCTRGSNASSSFPLQMWSRWRLTGWQETFILSTASLTRSLSVTAAGTRALPSYSKTCSILKA